MASQRFLSNGRMQRTYARRAALRRRSGAQSQTSEHWHEPDDQPLNPSPSPPRKRHKVFVEIISPKRKRPSPFHLKPAETRRPYSSAESLKTPERPPRDSPSRYTTPSHSGSGGSRPTRGSIVKRMLGRSRTESSLDGMTIRFLCALVTF